MVGSLLVAVGFVTCLFVYLLSIRLNLYNVFFTVGLGMTTILGMELILMGIFLCRSAVAQRIIISKIND